MKYLLLTAALLLPGTTLAEADFSRGHREMQRYFENSPKFATHKAIWIRYNRLLLSADTGRVKAKRLAKIACKRLLENGFVRIDVAVAVSDHRQLLNGNQFSGEAERYCER